MRAGEGVAVLVAVLTSLPRGRSFAEDMPAKRLREQVFQAEGSPDHVVADDDGKIIHELTQELPAGSARDRHIRSLGVQGQRLEVAPPGRHGSRRGDALGAEGETIGGVLHVATDEQSAVTATAQSAADGIPGIRGMGVSSRLACAVQ